MARRDDVGWSRTTTSTATMMRSWSSLSEVERGLAKTASTFLNGRLAERETVEWALRLEPHQLAEKMAVLDHLNGNDVESLTEPYLTAWRLIEESWSAPTTEIHPSIVVHNIGTRVEAGEQSGSLISAITDLVRPRLEVMALEQRPWQAVQKPGSPKRFGDLLSARLTSISLFKDIRGGTIDIGLACMSDGHFLGALASELTSVVDQGHYVARRIYGDNENSWGDAGRVVNVHMEQAHEINQRRAGLGAIRLWAGAHNRGLAPSVKLLHATISRLAEVDPPEGAAFVRRWRDSRASIYRRLWASLVANNSRLACAGEVANFLMSGADVEFWDVRRFPEVAELRARRFSDLGPRAQESVLQRLHDEPPRALWPQTDESAEVDAARQFWVVMELRRIEIAGAVLPKQSSQLLLEAMSRFPELENMAVDSGRIVSRRRPMTTASQRTETKYDELEGQARLQLLNDAMSAEGRSAATGELVNPAKWLREPEHLLLVLSDFESAGADADRFPYVWDTFCSLHTPESQSETGDQSRDAISESKRVLWLLRTLSASTLEIAVGGISDWLQTWRHYAVRCEYVYPIWFQTWPMVVARTNAAGRPDVEASIDSWDGARVAEDIRMPNTPTGKFVGVFLEALRSVDKIEQMFGARSLVEKMRDCVISERGYSGVIGRAMLTRELATCREVYPKWAKRHLLEPLLLDNDEAVVLWRAVATNWIGPATLKIIGEEALKRILDDQLDGRSREDLVYCLVCEALYSFDQDRESAVDHASLTQVLRVADEKVRVEAASTLWTFLQCSFEPEEGAEAAGVLFRTTVWQFLKRVWPQERSFESEGVSRHLATLPAISGDAFVEAVGVIERFLSPFRCHSMLAFGFYDGERAEEMKTPRLAATIDDEKKARALLCLLDLSIDDSQHAVFPEDLGIALERIEAEAPELVGDGAFRRLSALARK